jgi:hypothetical protein
VRNVTRFLDLPDARRLHRVAILESARGPAAWCPASVRGGRRCLSSSPPSCGARWPWRPARGALLGARDCQAGPHRAADPAGLRETVREAAEERCRGGDLRGSNAAEHAVGPPGGGGERLAGVGEGGLRQRRAGDRRSRAVQVFQGRWRAFRPDAQEVSVRGDRRYRTDPEDRRRQRAHRAL